MATVTTMVIIASLLTIVILTATFAAWVMWFQNPEVQISAPTDILGTLNVTCTKSTIVEGPITYDVIDSLITKLEIGVKSHVGYDLEVKEIVPYTPDFLKYKVILNPPLKIPGKGYESTVIDVNWGEGGALSAKVFPGDKYALQYGGLVKVENGVIKLYVGSLPTTQPTNYVCPFRGSVKYTPTVNGDTISVDASTPGCAPLLAVSNYAGSKLLVVGKFSVLEYKYEQYDIPLYIHVYGASTDRHGMLYHGGTGGAFNLIELYPGTWGYSPYYKNPMYFVYYIDADQDVERIYVDDDVVPPISIVQAMQADELSNVVIGLAREKPAKNAIYIAFVMDNSWSMQPYWDSLYNAIQSAIDLLREKNTYLALVDFTGPNCDCHNSIYCDLYIRVQTDFTQNYQLILDKIANTPVTCTYIEPDADAIYKAATYLSWPPGTSDAKVIVLATDEADQAIYVTHQQAVDAAKSRNIAILVVRDPNADNNKYPPWVRYYTNIPLDDYAEQTGGQVFIIGQNTDSLGDVLLQYLEGVNLSSARITTEIPVLGIFRDSFITITGLYPGDRVIITAPTGARYEVEAQTSTVKVNVLDVFTPKDIVAAVEQGGFNLIVQPTSEHMLNMLPKMMWVHVLGKNINLWVPSSVSLVPKCTLNIEGSAPGMVRIENRGDVYRIYYSTDGGKTWKFYGTYPRVDVTILGDGATIRIMDVYGNTKTYTFGTLVQEWSTRIYMLTASVHMRDKIVFRIGDTGIRIEEMQWLYIDVYGGPFEVTAYIGK